MASLITTFLKPSDTNDINIILYHYSALHFTCALQFLLLIRWKDTPHERQQLFDS